MKSIAGILILTLACACGGDPVGVSPEPSIVVAVAEEFLLAPGETARLPEGTLRVRFDEVTEDSRCPRDVACPWQGRALVALTVHTEAGAEQVRLEVTAPARSETIGRYKVELLSLFPEPVSTRPIPPNEYRINLRVLEI